MFRWLQSKFTYPWGNFVVSTEALLDHNVANGRASKTQPAGLSDQPNLSHTYCMVVTTWKPGKAGHRYGTCVHTAWCLLHCRRGKQAIKQAIGMVGTCWTTVLPMSANLRSSKITNWYLSTKKDAQLLDSKTASRFANNVWGLANKRATGSIYLTHTKHRGEDSSQYIYWF